MAYRKSGRGDGTHQLLHKAFWLLQLRCGRLYDMWTMCYYRVQHKERCEKRHELGCWLAITGVVFIATGRVALLGPA